MVKHSISLDSDKLIISDIRQGISTHGGLCLICRKRVHTLPDIIDGIEIYFHGYLCPEHREAVKKICKGGKDG